MKVSLRLKCHNLNCDHYNLSDNRRGRSADVSHCLSCPGHVESITHILCVCPSYSAIRVDLFKRISAVDPVFPSLSLEEKVKFILFDDSPVLLDTSIYFFLFSLFQIRAKLGDPTGPGQVSPSL